MEETERMGATVAVLFMLFSIIFGSGILIFGIFLFRMQRKEEKAGKRIPVLNIVSILMMIAGVILWMIPVAFFTFAILVEDYEGDEDYVDTGIMIEKQENVFEHEGVRYEQIPLDKVDEKFIYLPNYEADMTVAFNLSEKDSGWGWLPAEEYTDVAYEVKNDAGVKLYYDGLDLFCPTDCMNRVIEYYTDDANFDMYLEWIHEESNRTISREIELSDEEWKILSDLDIKEAEAVSDHRLCDSEYVDIVKRSKDEVMEAQMSFVSVGGIWYWDTFEWEEDAEDELYELLCRLPEDLQEKFNTVMESKTP